MIKSNFCSSLGSDSCPTFHGELAMCEQTLCIVDALESRVLLSGSHSHAVVSDKAQIAIDMKLLHSHAKSHQNKIHHDQGAIHKDLARIKSATQHKVKADMAAFNKTLKADRKAIITARKVDMKLIQADNAKLHADHANATLTAQDETQLQVDDQKLADDLANLDTQLQADEQQESTTLTADEQDGEAQMNGSDPTLQQDENQLNQDQQDDQSTSQNDSNQLQSDESKLEVDLETEANGNSNN
jgi:hypothetical protein